MTTEEAQEEVRKLAHLPESLLSHQFPQAMIALNAAVEKLKNEVIRSHESEDIANREWNKEWDKLDTEEKWRKEAITFFRGYEKDGRTFATYGCALVRCLLRAEKRIETLVEDAI